MSNLLVAPSACFPVLRNIMHLDLCSDSVGRRTLIGEGSSGPVTGGILSFQPFFFSCMFLLRRKRLHQIKPSFKMKKNFKNP